MEKIHRKNFQITEEEIVSKSNEIQENFFQRKMNQKASKHSRLFEEREKEKRGFWNFTFVKRERESFAEGSSERKRLDREIENELYRNA